jgi:hypothetical protein
MLTDAEFLTLATAWKRAAEVLSVRLESPYRFKTNTEKEVPCVGYLPDFGGPKGMVISYLSAPEFGIDSVLASQAKSFGFYCSFINPKVYEKYDEEVFKEALVDWGFFGNEDMRPSWMKR